MINSIDRTIERLFREFLPEEDFNISFSMPNKEWFSKLSGNKPVVNIYLYDIRENLQLRSNEWNINRESDGKYSKEPPLTRLDLFYLVTVWSPDLSDGIEEEHYLLSLIFSNLFKYSKIPPQMFYRDLKKIKPLPEIPISVATQDAFKEQGIGQFWSTMELGWKPAVYLTVTAPVVLPPVAEGRLITSKIMKTGHKDFCTVLSLNQYVRLYEFYKDKTSIYKLRLTGKSSKLLRWRKKGYRTAFLDNIEDFNSGDWFVIVDGERTEICKIIYKNPSTGKVVLRDKLLFSHRKNVEIKRLEVEEKLSAGLVKNAYKNQYTIFIKSVDTEQIRIGDIIMLEAENKKEVFMVTGVKEDIYISEDDEFFQFGGIVTNKSDNPSPLAGVKIELIDTLGKTMKKTFTDMNGRFLFNSIVGKPEKIRFYKEGYREKIISLPDISALSSDILTIRLESED